MVYRRWRRMAKPTTSLIAQVLDAAGLDPTVVNGGIITWGSNARHGSGDWMVAEADESDGTMVKLPATIAVITNIDPEHLDHWHFGARARSSLSLRTSRSMEWRLCASIIPRCRVSSRACLIAGL